MSGRRREQQRSKAAGEPGEALVGQGAVGPQRLDGGGKASDGVGEVVELGCVSWGLGRGGRIADLVGVGGASALGWDV